MEYVVDEEVRREGCTGKGKVVSADLLLRVVMHCSVIGGVAVLATAGVRRTTVCSEGTTTALEVQAVLFTSVLRGVRPKCQSNLLAASTTAPPLTIYNHEYERAISDSSISYARASPTTPPLSTESGMTPLTNFHRFLLHFDICDCVEG